MTKNNHRSIGFIQITILYVLTNFVPYTLIPSYSAIKKEFIMGDWYVGFLTGGFLLFNALAAVPWSYFSDSGGYARKIMLALSFGGASFFLFMAYLSPHPYIFMVMWLLAGAALGSILPLGFSVLADLYPSDRRVKVFMLWYTIGGFGLALGFLTALVSSVYFNWRFALFIASMLLFTIGVPTSLFLHEPNRGESDIEEELKIKNGAKYGYRFRIGDIRYILSNKTNYYTALQGIFGTIPNGVIFTWTVHFISRDGNASITAASLYLGIMSIGALGGISISHLADYLHKRNLRYKALLAGISSIIEAFLFILFFLTPFKLDIYTDDFQRALLAVLNRIGSDKMVLLAFMAFFGAMFFNAAVGPIKNSTISDVNLPEHRAIVLSGINFLELIAKSIGITLVGVISYYTGDLRFPSAAMMTLWIISGYFWIVLSKYYEKDKKQILNVLKNRVLVEHSKSR